VRFAGSQSVSEFGEDIADCRRVEHGRLEKPPYPNSETAEEGTAFAVPLRSQAGLAAAMAK
jgi:hypothetical protein